LEAAGFGYIANHGTKELHRVARTGHRCLIGRIVYGGYCTALWAYMLRRFCGYGGCYYCNGEYHYK
jgi:hypothetical protein